MTMLGTLLVGVNLTFYGLLVPGWFPQTYFIFGVSCAFAAPIAGWWGYHVEAASRNRERIALAVAAGLLELAAVFFISMSLLLNWKGS